MIGTRKFAAVLASILFLLNGCKVGPNYKRPVVVTPDQYRGVAPDLPGQPPVQPFAEMQWETVFQDEALRALIKEALTNNYDMLIAASRILQAQAVVGITRANQLPNVSGSGGVDYQRNAFALNGPTVDSLGIFRSTTSWTSGANIAVPPKPLAHSCSQPPMAAM
jgi:multidrug efflux system outer membrane protein